LVFSDDNWREVWASHVFVRSGVRVFYLLKNRATEREAQGRKKHARSGKKFWMLHADECSVAVGFAA
jgi:hypothetical protein